MSGYTAEDLTNRTIFDFIAPEDVNALASASLRLQQEGHITLMLSLSHRSGEAKRVNISAYPLFKDGRLAGSTAIITDITSRIKLEKELQEKDLLFKTIVEASPDNITITDLHGTVMYSSPRAAEMFGVENSDLFIGRNLLEFIDPSCHAKAIDRITGMVEGERYGAEDYKAIKTDGTPFYIEVNGEFIHDDQGRPQKMLFVVRDITRRKEIEEDLTKTKALFETLINTVNDAVYEISPEGILVFISPVIERIIGYTPDQLTGKHFLSFVFEEDRARIAKAFEEITKTDFRGYEFRLNSKSGGTHWIRTNTNPIIEDGVLVAYRGVLSDIHQRKSTELAASSAEKKYSRLFESMAQGVVYQDVEGKIFSANPSAVRLLGLTLEQMQGITSIDPRWRAIHPDGTEFPGTEHPAMIALKTGKPVTNVEMGVYHPEKQQYVWILVSAEPEFREGEKQPYQVFTTFTDITFQKFAEFTLRKSEARFKDLFESASVGMVLMGNDNKWVIVNRRFTELTGYSEDMWQSGGKWWELAYPDPDYREKEMKAWQLAVSDHLDGKNPVTHREVQVRCYDGTSKWFEISFVASGDNLIITFVDINRRIIYADELITQKNYLVSVLNAIPDLVFITDQDGVFLEANHRLDQRLLVPYDEFIGKKVVDIMPGSIGQDIMKIYAQVLKSKPADTYQFELEINQQTSHFEARLAPFGNDKVIILVTDINKRIETEMALRKTEEQMSNAFIYSSVGTAFAMTNGKMFKTNPALSSILGYTEKELIKKRFEELTHPDDLNEVNRNVQRILDGEIPTFRMEKRYFHKTGRIVWGSVNVSLVRDQDGSPLHFITQIQDITDRKLAEDEIETRLKSEAILRTISEYSIMHDNLTDFINSTLSFLGKNLQVSRVYVFEQDFKSNRVKNTFEWCGDGVEPQIGELSDFYWEEMLWWKGKLLQDQMIRITDIENIPDENLKSILRPQGIHSIMAVPLYLKGNLHGFLGFDDCNARREWPEHFVSILQSISVIICRHVELAQSQQSLKTSEKKYKSLFYDSPDGYLLIKDGVFIECNNAAEILIGGDRSLILGKAPAELSPEFQPNGLRSADYAESLLNTAFEKGNVSFEWTHLRFDGDPFVAQVSISPIEHQGENVLLVIQRDITDRKKNEEQIQKLLLAVEQSPVSIVITNLSGEIEYANPKACETTGYSLEELLGKNPNLLKSGHTHPDEYVRLWNNISNGSQWRGIFHNKRKNGELYWESSTISPILNSNGQITHFVAVKEDITEQRSTQIRLQKSQNRLSLVNKVSRTVIWETDPSGKVTFVNQMVAEILGYDQDMIVGKFMMYDVFVEDDKKRVKDFLQKREGVNRMITRVLTKNDKTIWVEVVAAPLFNEADEFTGFIGSLVDVTEKVAAEEELRKFRTTIDQSNYGSAIASLDGILLYCNAAFAGMHGYEPDELTGKHLRMLHTDEQLPSVIASIKTLQSEGSFTALEIWRRKKDGSVFPSLMNAIVIRDNENVPLFMSASALDITEIKEAQKALTISEQQLNHAQEIAKMGSWEFDVITGSVQWSKNYYKIVGTDPSQPPLSLEEIKKLIHPDDQELFENKLVEMDQSHTIETFNCRFVEDDGSVRWIQNNMLPRFENDRLVSVSGVSLDITDKMVSEEKIRSQNQRLGAIVAALPDLIFVLDREGNYKEFYAPDSEQLLAQPVQLVGSNLRDFFSEEQVKVHMEMFNRCFETQRVVVYEYTISDPAEGQKYYEARLAPMENDLVLASVRNITEKKISEKEIKKLSLAVEQSPVSIVITDLDANIEYVNPAFTASSGYSFDEVNHRNTRILKSGKTNIKTYQQLWQAITSGKTWHGEWVNKKKDGELFWEDVMITPISDETGQIVNYLAVKQDITQKKETERQIRELNTNLERKVEERTNDLVVINNELKNEIEERKKIEKALQLKTDQLEKFFTVSLDLLAIADVSGDFIKVNNALADFLGVPKSEIEGHSYLSFIHPDDVPDANLALQELEEQNNVIGFINRYRHTSGEYRYLEWRSAPQGELVYSAARDVTERINLEQALLKSIEKEKELSEMKSRFVSIASHEFRTPLASILLSAENLLAYWKKMDEARILAKLQNIRDQVNHLGSIVSNVMQVSKIQEGKVKIETMRIDLVILCNQVISDFNDYKSLKRKIHFECDAKQISLQLDGRLMLQVLQNLISNAIKYSQPDPVVTVKLSDHPAEVVLEVCDNGIGIPPEDQKHLFEPFFRAKNVGIIEGNGLGLNIVRESVQLHGGQITFVSEPGNGTVFTIRLPKRNL